MSKKDFFVSYNEHDKQWAEWIAWQLEAAGYKVLIQLWDWGPGNNFILEMQKASELCKRTIIVLSPHFLKAQYTQPEWAQAFAQDPTGENRLLIPVRVATCELKGFFSPLVYIDFLDTPPSNKSEQREYLITKLLDGVDSRRKKPVEEPPLPYMESTLMSAAALSGDEKQQQSESIKETPPNSKFHGKQHSKLLHYFATDWLPNGPPVAILQGFPGCGKTQLASAIAANAPLSLDPIEASPDAQDPSLDILMSLADALASEGITDLIDEFEKETDGDLFNALLKVLRRERILIVIDEFQRLFANRDTHPPVGWQHLIENLNNSNRPVGRLLLISNRAIKKVRWCEKCDIQGLKGFTDSEAAAFLADLLKSKDLTSKVPTERLEEICHRLDGNPRALITLVESLVYDSLEELLSLALDLFSTGDVEIINHDLIEDFERELIERTLSHMEGDLLKFMRWIAVHRRPFKKEAFSEFPSANIPTQVLRKQLIDRFLLTNTPSGDTMHPLAREISVTRLRNEKAEWKQAHNLAANYHFRHFKAIQVKGAERCITSYAELRHHLFEAGRISELYLASDKLAQFALSQIPKTTYSQAPSHVETLEERIALISALPEDSRPKGLEYHLALCLKHRNTGDDYQRALFHVQRAVGPNVYYAVWLLLIELEYSLNGIDAMLKAQDEALKYLGNGSNAFAIYHRCANLLGKDHKLDAAINVLEKGISTPGVKCLSPLISLCSRYMEETGRYDDAIRILKKCIDMPNTPELWKVYVQCAKLMAQMNRSGEAAALLQKGLTVSGMTSLQHIYLLLAELMVIDKKDDDVIRLLKDGISDARVIEKKDIYCLCAELLVKNNRVEEAIALLENGISSKSIKDPVPLYHKFAMIMEESGNADGGVKFLKGAMSHPIMSLEPSTYLICAKQLFHARNIDDAISVLKQGLLVSNMKDKDQLYKMCAELIERQGRLDDAIGILEKGIADKSAHNQAYLYQTCSELLEKSGRLNDAIEMLKKGINAPALTNKVVLFQVCAKLLKKADRTPEGIELIEKAIHLPGMTGLVILYRACAELMVTVGRQQDAVQLLYNAIDGPKIGNLTSLYQLCANLMIAAGQREEAITLLKKGILVYPRDKDLKSFYEKAG
ncbi:TIR domain-containing protein [Methylobacter sp.]|uniref:TIR domain-containing protein n=1 Tax=Methylobacter sp. TaxID=2051955 RepID=UPI002489BDBF|nr:TIR domain-containing protein [Methylobacter sp.]MDI1279086.1 TIR domain-containing protein [Methylobacter sp.]MDI1359904.1 TIR domain-containing protein [Methylobacter sp.]